MSATAEIRPFTVTIPARDLEDLRDRIDNTRWPERETVPDLTQGVQLETMQELARYWTSDYDLRRVEARLNELPQFMTEIDGLDIHFIHVRSRHENAMPLILTHGWPGSVVEFLQTIDLLTDPETHGADAADAFHVVVPSIPGYGFSGRPDSTGWGPDHIARAWAVLMTRLGYDRYAAQGGDWGAIITDLMGAQAPDGLIGIHSNMPGTVPADVFRVMTQNVLGSGEPKPTDLSAAESRAYDQLSYLYTKGIGYALEMALHPQTLYGLADSPVALAAWMIDHDRQSYEDISAAFVQKEPVGMLTRDEVLDNVTLAWLTNTGISSARLYWESAVGFFDVKGVRTPAAVSVFPHELYQAPRSWTDQAYPNLVYFHEVDAGNHFAAWQEPELFAGEVRDGLRPLR
ncbi:epoxide hydrolase family protein [Asanoa siamensis]|uniref:Hydrolase n=1 Tax=Asanoa siamensis TaxID=926357 RepID=A0ABQ4CHU6_9ACTN|nr:epoxide hydrolase family protein [Asanoa siamensis]GIF70878.1 hydrolase [Asanoa siamensis]